MYPITALIIFLITVKSHLDAYKSIIMRLPNRLRVVDFNPISTNPAGFQSKKFILGCNLKITARHILTRLKVLGCNCIEHL
jgi:hypothetical protein